MRRLLLAVIVTLVLFTASLAQAQGVNTHVQLTRLLARTEARHQGARLNFVRMLGDYPDFLSELQAVAARLETRPEWLLNVMACESSFIPSARNRQPGQTASGLMQIIESTARGLGTTTAEIRRMNPIGQLQLVEKYFAPFRGRLGTLADVYLAAFRGFAIEGGPDTIVAPLNNSAKERRAYSLNSGLDLNGDRNITKGEIEAMAYGVGRFGSDSQLIATARSRINQHEQIAGERKDLVQASSMSLYAARKVGTDPAAESPATPPKTRSIYVR